MSDNYRKLMNGQGVSDKVLDKIIYGGVRNIDIVESISIVAARTHVNRSATLTGLARTCLTVRHILQDEKYQYEATKLLVRAQGHIVGDALGLVTEDRTVPCVMMQLAPLIARKGYDYNHRVLSMLPSSIMDIMINKVFRILTMKENGDRAVESDSLDQEYMDVLGYGLLFSICGNHAGYGIETDEKVGGDHVFIVPVEDGHSRMVNYRSNLKWEDIDSKNLDPYSTY